MSYDLITLNGPVFVDPEGGIVKTTGGTSVLQIDATMKRGGNTPFHGELQYLGALKELLDMAQGDVREDRTGVGTYSVFGRQMRFNLEEDFPLLTTKNVFSKGVFTELCWFLRGDTNIGYLQANGVHIWDDWADENGEVGPVYGKQWRAWEGKHGHVDQIDQLITGLKENPGSRRHIINAWNVPLLDEMGLPPCHLLAQFYVTEGKLCCQVYQRSADIFLGVPFNIASYAALTKIIAQEVGLHASELIMTFGDLHLYSNHVDQAAEQLTRTPRDFPQLTIGTTSELDELEPEDFKLEGYDPHPAIKAEVAV